MEKIKEKIEKYFNFFEYNIPYEHAPMSFYFGAKERTDNFITFIYDTLCVLEDNNKSYSFIKSIENRVKIELKCGTMTLDYLQSKWLVKYNIDYNDIISLNRNKANNFIQILEKEYNTHKEDMGKDSYNIDELFIREDFYFYWYGLFLNQLLNEITNINSMLLTSNIKSQKNNNFNNSIKKVFPELLLHKQNKKLANELKKEFSKDKGITIRYMIEALQNHEPKLLSIENRARKATYESLKIFFGTYIGSLQSVFDKKLENIKDNPDYQAVNNRVMFILNSLK